MSAGISEVKFLPNPALLSLAPGPKCCGSLSEVGWGPGEVGKALLAAGVVGWADDIWKYAGTALKNGNHGLCGRCPV